MRAVMFHNARYVTGDGESRSLYVGDLVDGIVAAEQIAAGNAEEISEAAIAGVPEETPLPPPAVPSESSEGAEEAPEEASEDINATQGALEHAEALGVDIASIQGTGKDGRITKADVAAAVAAKEGQ